jgi:hypothetical protein
MACWLGEVTVPLACNGGDIPGVISPKCPPLARNLNFQFRHRRGIGTVITTLIILIASVVLGAGVIFFGGSLFQTNTENESIQVSNAHIWVGNNSTGTPNPDSVAGFVVQNTGGKVVAIQSITVRGQSVPVSQWWYNNTQSVATATNTQKELVWESNFRFADGYDLRSSTAGQETVTKATGPISLSQGQAAFIFLDSPAGINSLDTGLAFTVNVAAGKASAVQSVSVVSAG